MNVNKIGFVYNYHKEQGLWRTHLMAPAPILFGDDKIRIYVGGWDINGISRIYYIDVKRDDPSIVTNICTEPVLEIGNDGCFDDNGVFPAHAYKFDNDKVWLYYTGFQKLDKIPFSNFSGLAISNDGGETFTRYSKAPVLDRQDEGLYTRAGISAIPAKGGGFHCVYNAGTGWCFVNGKNRPIYDVFYQYSKDGINFNREGTKIVRCNLEVEHGLGRPQIIELGEYTYVFYTRRIIKDMRYFMGATRTKDYVTWERCDDLFENVDYGDKGEFDCDMIYFPAAVKVAPDKAYLFYCGNHYGEDGIGYIELTW